MEAIFERIKEVIGEQLGIEDIDTITMETTFIDDLGADSLDIVQLIMALEEEFDMEIPEAEAEKITSVGDVVEYIQKHQQRVKLSIFVFCVEILKMDDKLKAMNFIQDF